MRLVPRLFDRTLFVLKAVGQVLFCTAVVIVGGKLPMEDQGTELTSVTYHLEVPLGGLRRGTLECIPAKGGSMVKLVQGDRQLAVTKSLFDRWCEEEDSPFSPC